MARTISHKDAMHEVIRYKKGEIDIYDGKHGDTVQIWDELWDEMAFMGYDPTSPEDIARYIRQEL